LNIKVESFTQRTAVVAVFTAACIASNYILIGLVNVKFMDLIIFISGYIFGPATGASIGILTWLIYGTLNPYGFSLPILAATASGETIYGIIGGVLGNQKQSINNISIMENLKFGILGFLLTFVYDQYTNIISGLVAGIPIPIALISGIPFSIIHEFSNGVFFFVGASPSISAINRLFLDGSKYE
jgi:hypothetical protein